MSKTPMKEKFTQFGVSIFCDICIVEMPKFVLSINGVFCKENLNLLFDQKRFFLQQTTTMWNSIFELRKVSKTG